MSKSENFSTDKELLFNISRRLLLSESVQQTADIIVEALISRLKSFDCAFFRFESTHNQLICLSYTRQETSATESFKLKPVALGAGVVGRTAVEQVTHNIANRKNCDYWLEHVKNTVSELTVPIVYEGQLLAVVDLEDVRESYFNTAAVDLVESIAELSSKFIWQQAKNDVLQFKLEQMDHSGGRQQQKKSYFSMLFEQVGDPIFIVSTSGKILDVNQRTVLSLGFSKNELIGQKIQKIEQILDANSYSSSLYKNVKHNDPLVIEGIHKRKDGSRFYVEIKMTRLDDGNIIAVARDITSRKSTLNQLENSREFLHEVIKSSPDVIYSFDFVNDAVVMGGNRLSKILGYSSNKFDSWESTLILTHPDDIPAMESRAKQVNRSKQGEIIQAEARLKHANGGYRWLQSYCVVFKRDDDGKALSELGTVRDITEKKILKRDLDQRENYYRALVEHAFDGIALYDADGAVKFCSGSALKLLDYTADDVKTMRGIEFVHPDDHGLAKAAWDWVIKHPGKVYRIPDYRITKKSGEQVWVENSFINLLNDPSVAGIISNFRDISYKKSSEKSLYKISNYDNLTELPNRSFLKKQLERYVSQAQIYNSFITLVYFDVVKLNLINSAWGHSVGDQALLYIVEVLRRYTEGFDFVARAGDDEFAVILNQKDSFEATKLVESVLSEFDSLIALGDAEVKITLRASIIRYPEDGIKEDELLNKAEITTKRVQKLPIQYAFYQPEDTQMVRDKLTLEKDIIQALNQDQFMLYYQPKVCLKTGEIDSVEALLRWKHPTKGFISPQLIVSIAEETSLIFRLTDWVIMSAMKQIKLWLDAGTPMKVSINLSAKDLLRDELIDNVSKAFNEQSIDPSLLDLEITESAALVDIERSVILLDSFRNLGLTISLDDFGTGYSSISHLTTLPVDLVKIDQSFIRKTDMIAKDAKHDNRLIIKNIIRLARSFKLTSLVEGVETVEQLELLKAYDCDLVQGYLFSQPVPAEDLRSMIESGKIDFGELTSYSSS